MLRTALAALLVAATLGALVGWLTSRWVSRRLRSLDATAERVGGGELALRVPLDGSDDAFDRLARRFNGMLDRIEDLLGGVRHATDHIAHDLRTPLTRLRNRLEELRRQPGDPGAMRRSTPPWPRPTSCCAPSASLLWLARIEAQAPARGRAAAGPGGAGRRRGRAVHAERGERGIRLQRAAAAGAGARRSRPVVPDAGEPARQRAQVRRRAEARSTCRCSDARSGALLQIDDRGPGIPERERERVFDRFQRLEATAARPAAAWA